MTARSVPNPGEYVYDLGCPLTQRLRLTGHAGPPKRVLVKAVFDWGLRVEDEDGEFDCEHWERAEP